mgnify:FL=1
MIKTAQGYFDIDNKEYVITDMKPVRTLKNYLWNEQIVAWYDQFGCGIANGKTDGVFRTLTNYSKFVFVKDIESGECFCPNRNFNDEHFDKFECHVGLGYHRVISKYNGVSCEITTLIPQSDYAEVTHIKIKNEDSDKRFLTVYFYNKPFVNLTWHDAYGQARGDKERNGLLFRHLGFNVAEKNAFVFTKASYPMHSYEVTDLNFKGIYNEISNPVALSKDELSCEPSFFDGEYCSAMQFCVNLDVGETKEINVVCCFGKSEEEVYSIADKHVSNESYYNELSYQKRIHDELDEKLVIKTTNGYLDNLENVWLKRQISLGKTWGRVYGKGFRDIMQDVSSFLSLDSATAKEKILSTLAYQKESGNTIRQFDPIFDYPYQDGACWIAQTVLAYLKETDDASILDEKTGYYQSAVQETVFEHMVRGYNYLLSDLGAHGLVKWRGGDWNDSIDNAGMKGIGESVWLSIATVKGINDFLEIARRFKPDYNVSSFETRKAELEKNILLNGFEGDRFIYGIDDLSRRIGSVESKNVKMFLNPQTWSVIANIGDKDIQQKVMDGVETHLKYDYGYLQSNPAFDTPDDTIGRLSYFCPGTYENGSVYNHGVAFKIYADCMLGRADKAYESLLSILPTNPKNKNNGMEPYAIGNMYFGPQTPVRAGYAPGSWITGTAGWIYRIVSEMMLGVKPDYDGLIIEPCLPNDIQHASVKRVFRGVEFDITLEHTGKYSLTVDSQKIDGNKVKLNGNKTISVYCEW